MNGGVTAAVKSVLEKPLHELTEDDILQLTREDCRRFLKDKGMRRPSWNKSQAIQQVICLKSLLEPSPPPNAAASTVKPAFRRPLLPAPLPSPASNHTTLTVTVNSTSSSSTKELSPADADGSVSVFREERDLNLPDGPSGSDFAREGNCQQTAVNSKGSPVSGKVNVYDGVPVDKAHTVMHLAASSMKLFQEEPDCESQANWRTPCLLRSSSANFNMATQDIPVVQSTLTDAEGQKNRQVSLQRYFEKKKDRGKFKMKRKIGSSTGLEMYLNHPMKVPVTNGQGTDSNTSTTSQPGLSPTDFGSIDKQSKNLGLSVDLNDKG